MTLNTAINPISIYLGADGKPLDGGKVYFGLVNQNPVTNPITVYWDDAGTQPAAQPISVSGCYTMRAGAPARVYVTQDDYSVSVYDKRGALVLCQADANASSTLRTDLAASSGASLVGYLPAGTGAVATTVQDQFRDIQSWFVNVKDAPFYAVGDGVEDDTVAIQAAIDSISTAGEIYLPPGTYKITASLNLNKRVSIVGSTSSSRGARQANLVWAGANNATMFVCGVYPVMGIVLHGLGISTTATGMLLVDGTGTFNLSISQCDFTASTYTKALRLKETSLGAADGSFWSRIRENTFTNTWIEVLDDSNATTISDNEFYADLVAMAGPSLVINGNVTINALVVNGNSFEGTYAAATYAVSVTNTIQFSFSDNRIENSTGGSLYLGQLLDSSFISGNFFNTPPVYGGSRVSSAHGYGQSFTALGNRYGATALNPTAEITKLDIAMPGNNLFKNGNTSVDWVFTNCTGVAIQDGSAGLRNPVVRLHTPALGTAIAAPSNTTINCPEIQLAIQNEDFVTCIFIVRAKSTNTATSVCVINTGDALEYWTIPKDDKYHVIKAHRRMLAADAVLFPTVYLAYASAFNAADEVWVGGIGVYAGMGGTELPFFDGWTTDPATAANTKTWQRGEVVRSVLANTGAPSGWMCTVKGTPGTWHPLPNLL